MSGPLNYTTKVPSQRTVAECSALLAEHGADAIAVTYQDKQPVGVQFHLQGSTFELPVDVAAMGRILAKSRPAGGMSQAAYRSPEHAERVAWRVVKDWLAAQLALVAAQQVGLDEVMLPYLITEDGRPLRHQWRDRLAITGRTS